MSDPAWIRVGDVFASSFDQRESLSRAVRCSWRRKPIRLVPSVLTISLVTGSIKMVGIDHYIHSCVPGESEGKMGMCGKRLDALVMAVCRPLDAIAAKTIIDRVPLVQGSAMTASNESIRLFRAAIRCIRSSVPHPVNRKLAFNVREIFDIYREVKDPVRVDRFLTEGWHDLGVLREIVKADPVLVKELFKNYEPIGTAVPSISEELQAVNAEMEEGRFEAPGIPHSEIEEEQTMALPN